MGRGHCQLAALLKRRDASLRKAGEVSGAVRLSEGHCLSVEPWLMAPRVAVAAAAPVVLKRGNGWFQAPPQQAAAQNSQAAETNPEQCIVTIKQLQNNTKK